MQLGTCGRTGMQLSVLGFGCGAVGGFMVRGDPADQERTVARAIAAGVNYFDTAVQYGDGESEKNLGRVLQKLNPANVAVGTKVRLPPSEFGRIADAVTTSLEGSLARLRLDRVDIFHLCLPQIKPEHIGDAVHPKSDGKECVPLPRRHVISARPCSTISECACHYSSPCRTAAHGADGVRRTPRYDRGIPCGSSRSTVLRMRFARVNAETSGGLECRSIERGG